MITGKPEEHITFNFLDVTLEFDEARVLAWLQAFQDHHHITIAAVDFIFCTDDYLLEINRQHLNHDYYTDIITFPYREGTELMSDIFISVDRVKENAEDHGVSFQEELIRVMAHGLLHLIGYDDKSEDKRTEMRKEEDRAIKLFLAKMM